MAVLSLPGQDGIHTLASGTAAPISLSVLVSASASSAVMVGAGIIGGDSTGTTTMQSMITTATTRIAGPSTTATPSIAVEATAAEGSIGLVEAITAEASIGPAQAPGLSTETIRLPEGTLNLTARAVSTPAPSAATTMADKREAFQHAEIRASAVVADFMAVAVAVDLTAAVAAIVNPIVIWR